MRRIAVLLAISVGLVAAVSAAPASATPAEMKMVHKINSIRRAYGLHRLRPSFSLFVSAKLYSHQMMSSDYFGHLSRIPVAARWRAAGETLEWHSGWRLRPRLVVSRLPGILFARSRKLTGVSAGSSSRSRTLRRSYGHARLV